MELGGITAHHRTQLDVINGNLMVFSTVMKFFILTSCRSCRFMDVTSHFNRITHSLTSHEWSLTSSHTFLARFFA